MSIWSALWSPGLFKDSADGLMVTVTLLASSSAAPICHRLTFLGVCIPEAAQIAIRYSASLDGTQRLNIDSAFHVFCSYQLPEAYGPSKAVAATCRTLVENSRWHLSTSDALKRGESKFQ